MNELRYRMFTEKNLSGDRLPSTLDALRTSSSQKIDIFSDLF